MEQSTHGWCFVYRRTTRRHVKEKQRYQSTTRSNKRERETEQRVVVERIAGHSSSSLDWFAFNLFDMTRIDLTERANMFTRYWNNKWRITIPPNNSDDAYRTAWSRSVFWSTNLVDKLLVLAPLPLKSVKERKDRQRGRTTCVLSLCESSWRKLFVLWNSGIVSRLTSEIYLRKLVARTRFAVNSWSKDLRASIILLVACADHLSTFTVEIAWQIAIQEVQTSLIVVLLFSHASAVTDRRTHEN